MKRRDSICGPRFDLIPPSSAPSKSDDEGSKRIRQKRLLSTPEKRGYTEFMSDQETDDDLETTRNTCTNLGSRVVYAAKRVLPESSSSEDDPEPEPGTETMS